jgi:molybdenum cofactor cytidylyltransferase
MGNIAIILLAAGSSSRFGHAKQLVTHNGKSLISHAISEAKEVSENVIIVLGANFERIKTEIEDQGAPIIYNKDWEEGMSSSIHCGLLSLLKNNIALDALILMVCDQPFVTSSLLAALIAEYDKTKKLIIASAYKDTIGTPVLFDSSFIPSLLLLKGQAGAKKIISENMGSVSTVSFPLGYIDIDTKEDYDSFQKIN